MKYRGEATFYSRGMIEETAIEDFGIERERNTKRYFTVLNNEMNLIISSLHRFMNATENAEW